MRDTAFRKFPLGELSGVFTPACHRDNRMIDYLVLVN